MLSPTADAMAAALFDVAATELQAVETATCKRRRCTQPVHDRELCTTHLGQVRSQERASQASARARVVHRGAPPVVLLAHTYDAANIPEYDASMELLHSLILQKQPDREEVAHTPSMPNVQALPNGLDSISGKWRELRLNFKMGLNMELTEHKVSAHCASSHDHEHCLGMHGHGGPHTQPHTDRRNRFGTRTNTNSRLRRATRKSGLPFTRL